MWSTRQNLLPLVSEKYGHFRASLFEDHTVNLEQNIVISSVQMCSDSFACPRSCFWGENILARIGDKNTFRLPEALLASSSKFLLVQNWNCYEALCWNDYSEFERVTWPSYVASEILVSYKIYIIKFILE